VKNNLNNLANILTENLNKLAQQDGFYTRTHKAKRKPIEKIEKHTIYYEYENYRTQTVIESGKFILKCKESDISTILLANLKRKKDLNFSEIEIRFSKAPFELWD